MFDIGFLELVLVGIIGLIILGPERLPVAARTLGRWIGRAKRMVSQFTQEIDKEIEIEELKAQLKKQGESLDINSDVRQIQETVSKALQEAERDAEHLYENELPEHQGEEFEPLPRDDSAQNKAFTKEKTQAEAAKTTLNTSSGTHSHPQNK